MAGRAVKPQVTEINPMFFIPEGIDELKYGDNLITVEADDVDENEFDVDIDADDVDGVGADDGTDYSDSPETPTIFGVILQTIHVDDTGSEVVDVVFDVEDVFNVDSYEIRATKT